MIRKGQDADKETLMQLWKLCFPKDSESFIIFYFDKVYVNDETLVYIEDEQPVASTQMIPYQIKTSDSLSMGGYISGLMTHPNYRNQRYMEKLLNASFDVMKKNGYDYTFLIPQEKWLIKVYEKYGYRLCEPSFYPHENKVLKSPKQWANIQHIHFEEKGILLEDEPVIYYEQKGMIKQLNPAVKEITSLYIGMVFD